MFGPNVKHVLAESTLFSSTSYMDHRGVEFREILLRLEAEFAHKFGLTDFNFCFVTGSGTFVNEIVISSLLGRCKAFYADAKFGRILSEMAAVHSQLPAASGREPYHMIYPAYETSVSRFNAAPCYNDKGTKGDQKGVVFADMVSAFPYYDVPTSVDIFTTVSSKQLGSYPVLGIIGVRKSLYLQNFVRAGRGISCLDLCTYLHRRHENQTPHTPAIPLYVDLLEEIRNFDLAEHKRKLNDRRFNIELSCDPCWIIGTGPVITLAPIPKLVEIARAFRLYQSKAGHQIFTWSGTDGDHDRLCKALAMIKGKGKGKRT